MWKRVTQFKEAAGNLLQQVDAALEDTMVEFEADKTGDGGESSRAGAGAGAGGKARHDASTELEVRITPQLACVIPSSSELFPAVVATTVVSFGLLTPVEPASVGFDPPLFSVILLLVDFLCACICV